MPFLFVVASIRHGVARQVADRLVRSGTPVWTDISHQLTLFLAVTIYNDYFVQVLSYLSDNGKHKILTNQSCFSLNFYNFLFIDSTCNCFSYFLSNLPAIVFIIFYRLYLQLFCLLFIISTWNFFLTFHRLYLQLFFLLFIDSSWNCFS